MCVFSNIMDNVIPNLTERYPWVPQITPIDNNITISPFISREEFDALKAEVTELRKLLKAAKEFDNATKQKGCEDKKKLELLDSLAELLGLPKFSGGK